MSVIRITSELGSAIHACNPSNKRLREEDGEFKASLG